MSLNFIKKALKMWISIRKNVKINFGSNSDLITFVV
jgi:hypothetical protein